MTLTFNWKTIQSFCGEIAASFVFGFAVYSAIISSTITDQSAGPVIVALAVGFSGIAIIYAFCDITIAHFNPAITLAAIVYCKMSIIKGIVYILCQLLGFMIAAGVVLGCFPGKNSELLDIIRPKKVEDTSKGELIFTELVLTGILTFVAFSVAINAFKKVKYVPSKEEKNLPELEEEPDKTILAPLTIGLTLGFLALLGFGSSGGVFNPGLVWAPVLFSGKWYNSWCYWVGEFVGALVGAGIQVFILARIY